MLLKGRYLATGHRQGENAGVVDLGFARSRPKYDALDFKALYASVHWMHNAGDL